MKDSKKIPTAVIKRLPRYYRYLGDLLDVGILRISSNDLSKRMGITASQIRQDLNHFGCFGQQGYGYNVELLYNELRHILGLDRQYKFILIGAGNFGQALLNYPNFAKRGYEFTAAFDNNPKLIGQEINGLTVQDVAKLKKHCEKNGVDIAAIAVPEAAAQGICNILAKAGVKGIWNFSNAELKLPFDVTVENVYLTDSLMTLSFKLNEDAILERAAINYW